MINVYKSFMAKVLVKCISYTYTERERLYDLFIYQNRLIYHFIADNYLAIIIIVIYLLTNQYYYLYSTYHFIFHFYLLF